MPAALVKSLLTGSRVRAGANIPYGLDVLIVQGERGLIVDTIYMDGHPCPIVRWDAPHDGLEDNETLLDDDDVRLLLEARLGAAGAALRLVQEK